MTTSEDIFKKSKSYIYILVINVYSKYALMPLTLVLRKIKNRVGIPLDSYSHSGTGSLVSLLPRWNTPAVISTKFNEAQKILRTFMAKMKSFTLTPVYIITLQSSILVLT